MRLTWSITPWPSPLSRTTTRFSSPMKAWSGSLVWVIRPLMCAVFPSMRRQSIAMWTKTSKPRLLSCSCPFTLPSAYFLAEKEKDRKVPSGLTMCPDPVADATTGLGAAGADWATNPASTRTPTNRSRAAWRFFASPPSFSALAQPCQNKTLPEAGQRQAGHVSSVRMLLSAVARRARGRRRLRFTAPFHARERSATDSREGCATLLLCARGSATVGSRSASGAAAPRQVAPRPQLSRTAESDEGAKAFTAAAPEQDGRGCPARGITADMEHSAIDEPVRRYF